MRSDLFCSVWVCGISVMKILLFDSEVFAFQFLFPFGLGIVFIFFTIYFSTYFLYLKVRKPTFLISFLLYCIKFCWMVGFYVISTFVGYLTPNLFLYVTLHKYLSQDESLFYARVTSGAVWHLTLGKISPSQDSYFGHMVLANNVGVNLGLDSSPTLKKICAKEGNSIDKQHNQ